MIKFNKQSLCKALGLSLFVVLSPLQTIYSMDLVQAWRNNRQADAFVNNFPSMTFNQARAAWNNVSDAQQQRIELADKKRNKNKENLIFNIVRYLSSDISENILLLFFNNNKTAVDQFLKMPIHKAFEQYSYSKQMVENSQYWHPGLDLKAISLAEAFMINEQLQVVARVCGSKKKFLQRKELEAFCIIESKSSLTMPMLINRLFKYRYYRKVTFDSLLAAVLPGVIIAGIVDFHLALLWLSCLIKLYGCEQTVVLDSVAQLNTLIDKTRALILESGQDELLKSLLPLENSMAYNLTDRVKIVAPFLLLIPLIGGIDFVMTRGIEFSDRLKMSVFYGFALGTGFAAVLLLLSYIPFEQFPGGFLGLGVSMNALIVATVVAFRYGAVHDWQEAYVQSDHISDYLEDSTFVVEDCFE